jgi:hypothetical protein
MLHVSRCPSFSPKRMERLMRTPAHSCTPVHSGSSPGPSTRARASMVSRVRGVYFRAGCLPPARAPVAGDHCMEPRRLPRQVLAQRRGAGADAAGPRPHAVLSGAGGTAQGKWKRCIWVGSWRERDLDSAFLSHSTQSCQLSHGVAVCCTFKGLVGCRSSFHLPYAADLQERMLEDIEKTEAEAAVTRQGVA